MNFLISALVPIIGADDDVLRDTARVMGYRVVGPLLCFSGEVPVDFILEAHQLQKMKNAAKQRKQKAIQTQGQGQRFPVAAD